ncbi:MAG: uL15 family ribosomal protein [bacterium]|nr:uL15 family ribosomal protein [bacterium]
MQLHELPSRTKQKKRIGRGGKKGTTSGRGTKGQKSRAGANMPPIVRELLKRYPKRRGVGTHMRSTKSSASKESVNVADLEKYFEMGAIITPSILLEKRLVRRQNGKTPVVKVLGKGEVTKAFTIEGCDISESAKAKIVAAKGSVSSLTG